MFCGSEEEERTRFRKKKRKRNKKKKQKILVAAKNELVMMKSYFKTYNHVNYFFAVLKSFFDESALYAKFLMRFSGLKAKGT